MSIIVDLCGRLADALGPTLTLDSATPLSISGALERLSAEYPALAGTLAQTPLRFAVDEVLAGSDALVAPGQRLALFPPVSGG